MKVISIDIGGKKQHLMYNGEAMFELRDKFGTVSELLEKLKEDTRESFNIACEAVAIMAEQGELARRYVGHTPEDFLTADVIKQVIQPLEIVDLKMIIPRVITLGFNREINKENEDEIDLGLEELNQKKTT